MRIHGTWFAAADCKCGLFVRERKCHSFMGEEREKSLQPSYPTDPIKSRFNGNYYRDYWIIEALVFGEKVEGDGEYGGKIARIKLRGPGIEILISRWK